MKEIIQEIIDAKFDQAERNILQMKADRTPQKVVVESLEPKDRSRIGNTQSKFYRLTEKYVTWASDGIKGEKYEQFVKLVEDYKLVFEESLKTDEFKIVNTDAEIVGFETQKTPQDFERIAEAEKELANDELIPAENVKEEFFGVELPEKPLQEYVLEPIPEFVKEKVQEIKENAKISKQNAFDSDLKTELFAVIDSKLGISSEILSAREHEICKHVYNGTILDIPCEFLAETKILAEKHEKYNKLKSAITEVLG